MLYVSDSLIGDDQPGLDALMVQARHNNALDGISGLLWTDGDRFAQVVEGDDDAIAELLAKLIVDPRHTGVRILQDVQVADREFGGWSMAGPTSDPYRDIFEQRMLSRLSSIASPLSTMFQQVISGSSHAVGRYGH